MNSKERKEKRYQNRKSKRTKCNEKSLNEIYKFNNLYDACKYHVKGKHTKSVNKFDKDKSFKLYDVYNKCQQEPYRSKGLYQINIHDRGRNRDIDVPHIEERIIQKCFVDNYLNDIISTKIAPGNIGNVGSFTDKDIVEMVSNDIKYIIHKYHEGYILLMDFKHYFDSIDPNKAINIVLNNVENNLIIEQTKIFIGDDIGIPFGSPVAQKIATVYPSPIDHFIKEKLCIKCYKRYIDDSYIMHPSKEYLEECLIKIKDIASSIGLELNDKKTKIVNIRDFEFLKIRYKTKKVCKVKTSIPRKKMKSIKKYIKKLYLSNNDKLQDACTSYINYVASIGSKKDTIEINEFINNLGRS